MRDELVNLEVAFQVVINQTWKLGAAFDTAESASFPYTTCDELECYMKKISKGDSIEVKGERTYVLWKSLDRQQRHQ